MALLIQLRHYTHGLLALQSAGQRRVSTRRRQALPILISLLFCFCLCIHTDAVAEEEPTEYSVKAAFLLNFTKFVDWPPEAFNQSDSPLTICIMGDDPFGPILDRMIESESVGGHLLEVRRIQSIPSRNSCQVLFTSSAGKTGARPPRDLGPGILSVGERDGFLSDGGIINFLIENHRVRFDVNLAAAERARLKLSSKLLSVARSVQK